MVSALQQTADYQVPEYRNFNTAVKKRNFIVDILNPVFKIHLVTKNNMATDIRELVISV
jgi:hypothetical protein